MGEITDSLSGVARQLALLTSASWTHCKTYSWSLKFSSPRISDCGLRTCQIESGLK